MNDVAGAKRLEIVDLGSRVDSEYETPELIRCLTSAPKSIPCCFFYDDQGSRFYEGLCRQPEYYLTRFERAILEEHSDDIVATTGPCEIVELGSGNPQKTTLLLGAYIRSGNSPRFFPIDINRDSIERGAAQLHRTFPNLQISGLVGTYAQGMEMLPPSTHRRLFLFMGSTIGNMTDNEIRELIAVVRQGARKGDLFLVGADLDKQRSVLEAAYNDAAGFAVRANLNVLQHVNWKYGGNFDLTNFAHLAFHNPALMQMEAHVRSLQDQTVTLSKIGLSVEIKKGESIQTEIMRKFDLDIFVRLVETEGYSRIQTWFDSNKWFSVSLFSVH